MIFARLLGLGAAYGLAFALIKGVFPTPVALLAFQEADPAEGNLTLLAAVYMGAGLVAGIIAAPLFGGMLALFRRGRGRRFRSSAAGPRLALSLALSAVMGVISALLLIAAYTTGFLQRGGVLDPVTIVEASNFSPGTPLIVAWTIARDVLPAGLAGLFLSPLGGAPLLRLYAGKNGEGQDPEHERRFREYERYEEG